MGRPKKTPLEPVQNQTTQEPVQNQTPLEPPQNLTPNNTELNIEPKQPKRGRPKGTPNKPKSNDAHETITVKPVKPKRTTKKVVTQDSIKMSVLGVHTIIAMYAKDAMISDANATAEAIAIKQVIDEFDMAWLAKYMPIVALAGTIAFCEAPTVKAVWNERESRIAKRQGKTSRQSQHHFIVPINPNMEGESNG